MPYTAAERQQRYKAKLRLDAEKYEEYKKKKRDNYHKKKRLVKDLSAKEKYNARVIWRLRKKQVRQRQKNLNCVLDITPPSSPSIRQESRNLSDNEDVNLDRENIPIPTPKNGSSKALQGKKKMRRDRSKLYRANLRLQEENEKLKKQCERYKKRCQRKEFKKKKLEICEETKYQKLSSTMKANYKRLKTLKEKKMLKNIITQVKGPERDEIIKESLGITSKLRTTIKVKISSTILKKSIGNFFLRDDISRATAGKKETCTKNGQKMQKRFMLDSMKKIFKTFKEENPGLKCSYFYFTKNKPFYVLKPTVSGREMCLCKTHTNTIYKASALKNKDVINTSDLNALIISTVCNPKNQACMYGTCNECKDMKINPNSDEGTEKIRWKEWERVTELYDKDNKQKKAFKNVKSEKEATVKELMQLFNEELKMLKKHTYNMKVQFHNFRQAVDNVQETEAVLVVDFSENYTCKLHEEIQAHQFGGSKQQVSLHTVVVYLNIGNNKKVDSYCTVSSDTNHQPAAIWAHMNPILKNIRNSHPSITTIHFFSDGPFSQYRQKQNFYLSSTTLFDYGFTKMTWSFFEAGHGKGPADGIGGYLKRSADDLVASGHDISCANDFYNALKDISKTRLYLISSDDISNVAKTLPKKNSTLVGTKNVHQIFTTIKGEIKYRHLSCFCKRGNCDCLSPKVFRPVEPHAVAEDSDEDLPLSFFKKSQRFPLKEIEMSDLCLPRQKNWYDFVYTPEGSDTESPNLAHGSCDKENKAVQHGDYLLVNVRATKGKIFKYVCVVNDLHDDGELRVTFLRCVKGKRIFRLDKNDISDIDYTDIIKILAEPKIKMKRGQQYIEFLMDVDILEK